MENVYEDIIQEMLEKDVSMGMSHDHSKASTHCLCKDVIDIRVIIAIGIIHWTKNQIHAFLEQEWC